MKKVTALLLVALMAVGVVSALDLGDFPTGKWLDEKWNGVWEFGVNSIKLNSTDGSLIYDFTDTMKDFKLSPSKDGLTLTFSCAETQRAYSFTKPLALSTDLILTVDPTWTAENYVTNIKFMK
ncbi:MAG: hypothetical protein GX220_05620 [Treponema sp.]|jgi:hypothetical protein|nr:hypothetical protein [Treponema sp.]